MVATAIVPFIVTWGFALVRIYVRWFMLKIWKIEDWLFVGSQVSSGLFFPFTFLPARLFRIKGSQLTVLALVYVLGACDNGTHVCAAWEWTAYFDYSPKGYFTRA